MHPVPEMEYVDKEDTGESSEPNIATSGKASKACSEESDLDR